MKYTIDRKTWRRGGEQYTLVTHGETMLLNDLGYMCCLGQCMLQDGIVKDKLLNVGDPADAHINSKFVHKSQSLSFYLNTPLAKDAMMINDDDKLQDVEREEKLINLFKDNDLEIEFIN